MLDWNDASSCCCWWCHPYCIQLHRPIQIDVLITSLVVDFSCSSLPRFLRDLCTHKFTLQAARVVPWKPSRGEAEQFLTEGPERKNNNPSLVETFFIRVAERNRAFYILLSHAACMICSVQRRHQERYSSKTLSVKKG